MILIAYQIRNSGIFNAHPTVCLYNYLEITFITLFEESSNINLPIKINVTHQYLLVNVY